MKLNSKRFVIRKSLIGKNAIITVNFKNGKTAKYNHDKVYEVMKDKLEAMACFIKYKSYTATNNVPLVAREICEQYASVHTGSNSSLYTYRHTRIMTLR